MTRIRFGFRSVFDRKYEVEQFDFLLNKTDQFNELYTGLDLWNQKDPNIKTLQVERRIEYFHFMYLPLFPIGKVWTLRKEDGLLYSLKSQKYKIESRVKKASYPIYTFIFPILVFLSGFLLILSIYGKKYLNEYRVDNSKNDRKELLINLIDSLKPPFYLVFEKSGSSSETFQRVDSIAGEIIYIGKLPSKLDTFKYGTLDHTIYSVLKSNKLNQYQISKDSLHSFIYGNKNLHEAKELKNVLSVFDLETPKLEISFNNEGLEIKNLGKPVKLMGFTDKSSEESLWNFQTDYYLATNERIQGTYTPKRPKTKIVNEIELTITFDDGDKTFNYEIQGIFTDIPGGKLFSEEQIRLMK